MKGVGCSYLVCDSFGAAVGCLGLGRFFQRAAEGGGDVFYLRLNRHRLEETFPQDVVNLVGGKIHRGYTALLPTQFLPGFF